jgi:hypothetical protein
MRALCDSCAKPQPPDWQGGDCCVWCGQAVRREVRCFWCANWTPAVKYCRTCGAGTVDSKLYGAARMLKDAGMDRFSVPRMLGELEPDQIENFTRIYQEQAVVAAHHVGHVNFLENYLQLKHWSAALEEELVPQLPWPRERLDMLRAAANRVPQQAEGLAKARIIGESSPFPTTVALAEIVRLGFEDWSGLERASRLIRSEDPNLRTEAALAISHWRVLFGPGLPVDRREVLDALGSCPLQEAASVRMALLGKPDGKPLPPGDFATALATDDVDSLVAAAAQPGDPARRYAAASKLIGLGVVGPVAAVLTAASPESQIDLLKKLRSRAKPAPELRETLFEIASATSDKDVRYGCNACNALGVEGAAEVLRIARAANGDRNVFHFLFLQKTLLPDALDQLGAFLIGNGAFSMNQFGLSDTAQEGRMPADFVPRHWAAANPKTRIELSRFAELQLKNYGDSSLHKFLVDVAYTPPLTTDDVGVQGAVWSSLYRWYDSFGFPRRRPLTISAESIAAFFGSPRAFLLRFARFLEGRGILLEMLQRDAIAEILSYPEESALPAFATAPEETLALTETLAKAMRDNAIDFILRLDCTKFLGFIGWREEFRGHVTMLLKSFAGTDLDLQSNQTLERMAQVASTHARNPASN